MAVNIKAEDIAQFSGTESHYRHFIKGLVFTDGINYLMNNGAGWLVDAIASHQISSVLNKGELKQFQLWELKISDSAGVLTCRADKNRKPVVTQEIQITDFPLKSIKIYVELGSIDGVNEIKIMMLPSER